MIPQSTPSGNRILDALPPQELQALEPHLTDHELRGGEVVHQAADDLAWVYFPTSCIFSIVMFMHDGASFEITTTGREGLTASPHALLGAEKTMSQIVCQVPGRSKRLDIRTFRRHVAGGGQLRTLAEQYAQSTIKVMGQSIGCNRLHPLVERCARWLLMTHDRFGSDDIPLTQEFLSTMLGVHRPAVSIAAATLQKAGFIRYRRGRIQVIDREGLESASCECYKTASGILNGRD